MKKMLKKVFALLTILVLTLSCMAAWQRWQLGLPPWKWPPRPSRSPESRSGRDRGTQGRSGRDHRNHRDH